MLIISGTATLDGTLTLDAANGYVPPNGTSFTGLTFASKSGNFSVVSGSLAPRATVSFTPTAAVVSFDKTNQTITFAALPDRTYGAAPFALTATASSGLPVMFSVVSGTASLAGTTVTVTGAGAVVVRATQPGDATFAAAPPVDRTFNVIKAALIAKADDKTKAQGAANPPLTISYAGFVNSENAGVLDVLPTISTTAVTDSPAGTYPISLSGGSDNNYALTLQGGTLTITSGLPEIEVQGKGITIASGDASPSVLDDSDFGVAAIGGSGVKHTFTIKNTGGSGLNLTGTPRVAVSGAHAAEFGVTQPATAAIAAGGQITFDLTFVPTTTGLRNATVSIANDDADENPYTFAVQGVGTLVSATHAVVGTGYTAGGTVTVTNMLTYATPVTALQWHVLLPSGFSFASDSGSAGQIKPAVGATGLLDWSWTVIPPSPVTFSYVLNVVPGTLGNHALVSQAAVSLQGGPAQQLLAQLDPLLLRPVNIHFADSDQNSRISLLELTRVIELYNTRNGTTRTGAYRVDPAGEDGFAPEPTRANAAVVTLSSYHSADTDLNGKLSLLELTRAIELYNYRNGTTRTGQYHAQAGTEDGFAPGP